MQAGFFDQEDRLTNLEKLDDLSLRLDSNADWQGSRPLLRVIRQKQRRRTATRGTRTNRSKADALAAPECGIGTA